MTNKTNNAVELLQELLDLVTDAQLEDVQSAAYDIYLEKQDDPLTPQDIFVIARRTLHRGVHADDCNLKRLETSCTCWYAKVRDWLEKVENENN